VTGDIVREGRGFMNLEDQLKSLVDNELGELVSEATFDAVSLPLAPRVTSATLPSPALPDERLTKAIDLELKSELSSERKEVLMREMWKCSRCGTVNGLQLRRLVIRKSCKKCAKLRESEPNLIEEMIK
jgi:hypothetical protein